jgi:hypothetical protein
MSVLPNQFNLSATLNFEPTGPGNVPEVFVIVPPSSSPPTITVAVGSQALADVPIVSGLLPTLNPGESITLQMICGWATPGTPTVRTDAFAFFLGCGSLTNAPTNATSLSYEARYVFPFLLESSAYSVNNTYAFNVLLTCYNNTTGALQPSLKWCESTGFATASGGTITIYNAIATITSAP